MTSNSTRLARTVNSEDQCMEGGRTLSFLIAAVKGCQLTGPKVSMYIFQQFSTCVDAGRELFKLPVSCLRSDAR